MSRKTKTTATKDEARPVLVPKLRFPDFSDPWAHEPLSKVLKEHKLKNTEGRDVFSVSMEYGIVNQIELLGRSFAAADTSHYTIGRRFDVVYTKSPLKAFPFGIVKQCKFDGEVALSPLYGVFTPPNPHLGLLIEAYFESPSRSKDFLSPLCQKGAKNTLQITNTTFLSGRLPLPTQPAEQQKIAECLSSVDELMAAQARKVDALKTHKKGLMQQLFPREGETVPRLRFPEFKDAGEWEESPLSNFILSLDAGVSVNAGDRPANKTEFGVLKTSAVTNGIFEPEENKVVLAESEQSRLKEPVSSGTIIISRMNTPALVGANAYVESSYENLFLPDRLWAAKPREGVSMRFLAFILGSDRGRAALSKMAKGSSGSMKNITKPEVLALSVMSPSPDEQHRIASCLTTLDALIAAETQKLAALKTHKKGLMQQLFPSPEGVEG
ncbi:MAG: restriction endonuclease subunit S [Desulfomicrobium sp.]